MGNNPLLGSQNRIWIQGNKPVTYDEVYSLIQDSKLVDNPVNDWCMVRRENTFSGESGLYDLDNISAQAVLQSMLRGIGLRDNCEKSIFEFLNPAEIGLDKTPYVQRLPIVKKLFETFDKAVCGSSYVGVRSEGSIFDPTSSSLNNSESTSQYWL